MVDKYFLNLPGPEVQVRRGAVGIPDSVDDLDRVAMNIPYLVTRHDFCGFDCGPGSSARGRSELALNILAHFLPGEEVETCGTRYSRGAAHLHLLFAEDIIAMLPREGGTLYAKAIQQWIGTELGKYPLPWTGPVDPLAMPVQPPQEVTQGTLPVDRPFSTPDGPEAPTILLEDTKRLVRLTQDLLYYYDRRPGACSRLAATRRQLEEELRRVGGYLNVPEPLGIPEDPSTSTKESKQ